MASILVSVLCFVREVKFSSLCIFPVYASENNYYWRNQSTTKYAEVKLEGPSRLANQSILPARVLWRDLTLSIHHTLGLDQVRQGPHKHTTSSPLSA